MLAVQLSLRYGLCDVRFTDCTNTATDDTFRRHFDQDTRDIVQIRVVHGSWKREDPNGIHIEVNLCLCLAGISFDSIKRAAGRSKAIPKYQSDQSVYARDVRYTPYQSHGPLPA